MPPEDEPTTEPTTEPTEEPAEEEETEETEQTSLDDVISQVKQALKEKEKDSSEKEDDEVEEGDELSEGELERRYRYHQQQAKAYRVAKSKGREPIEATQERLKARETEMSNREKVLSVKEHLVQAGIPAAASGLIDISNYKFEGNKLSDTDKMVKEVKAVIDLFAPESREDDSQPGRQHSKPKGDVFDDIAKQIRNR